MIFPFSVFPIWTEPSMHPATNNGELYEHSTECTSVFNGITQAFPLPISQKETSAFPDPMSKNLSLSSNHEMSNTASLIIFLSYFLINDSDSFNHAAFKGLDMDSTCANNTKICSRSYGKYIS